MPRLGRYFAFAFPYYYPQGGADDFIGAFDTLEAAQAAVRRDDGDSGNVLDSANGERWWLSSAGMPYGTKWHKDYMKWVKEVPDARKEESRPA